MHLHTSFSLPARGQTAVEVTIWENYLLSNRTNISRTLHAYSLDNGPCYVSDEGRLVFRFTAFDWDNSIEQALRRAHIYGHVLCHFRLMQG